jgi:hypothetical protein
LIKAMSTRGAVPTRSWVFGVSHFSDIYWGKSNLTFGDNSWRRLTVRTSLIPLYPSRGTLKCLFHFAFNPPRSHPSSGKYWGRLVAFYHFTHFRRYRDSYVIIDDQSK